MLVRLVALTAACIALGGCDPFAFVDEQAERDRIAERPASGFPPETTVFPVDLPKIPAGKFRATTTIDGKVTSRNSTSCEERRSVQTAMMDGESTLWCPAETQAFSQPKSGSYRYQAKCDFPEDGGKQTVNIKLNGDFDTSFTIERVTLFESGEKKTKSVRWEYRGAC